MMDSRRSPKRKKITITQKSVKYFIAVHKFMEAVSVNKTAGTQTCDADFVETVLIRGKV
jgi:hypothetical protein